MNTVQTTKSTLQKGFTLIELLVVLGILGILATALVATIDPFEQLKKASDANIKNAAVEVANASLRYFTTHNAMPWHTVGLGGVASCGTAGGVITPAADTNNTSLAGSGLECLTGLVDDGELKQQFTSATTITTKLFLTGTVGNDVKVCYKPSSKSQQRDVNTAYTFAGAPATAGSCKSMTVSGVTGTNDCYWCATL